MSTETGAEYTMPGYVPAPRDTLPVSEVFGPVWQGEGPYAGRRCGFIRLGMCNLTCTWCDTPFTWDRSRYNLKQENPERLVPEIVSPILDMGVAIVVISGGEPLIHQVMPAWKALLDHLKIAGIAVHIETNGTIEPNEVTLGGVQHFTVSPKLGNSGVALKRRNKPVALRAFAAFAAAGKCAWKFVAERPEDLVEAGQIVHQYSVPRHAVWVMPEGTDAERILTVGRRLAPAIATLGWNFTLRQHAMLYGTERGR